MSRLVLPVPVCLPSIRGLPRLSKRASILRWRKPAASARSAVPLGAPFPDLPMETVRQQTAPCARIRWDICRRCRCCGRVPNGNACACCAMQIRTFPLSRPAQRVAVAAQEGAPGACRGGADRAAGMRQLPGLVRNAHRLDLRLTILDSAPVRTGAGARNRARLAAGDHRTGCRRCRTGRSCRTGGCVGGGAGGGGAVGVVGLVPTKEFRWQLRPRNGLRIPWCAGIIEWRRLGDRGPRRCGRTLSFGCTCPVPWSMHARESGKTHAVDYLAYTWPETGQMC